MSTSVASYLVGYLNQLGVRHVFGVGGANIEDVYGAAIPITLDEAIEQVRLKPGSLLALGGFSHAGDYAASAIVRWGKVACRARWRSVSSNPAP